ncbi:hypothetical protein HJC23_006529 [Cyclotella cryptica]|uniref:LRRK2 ARM repeat domain-containing protein n=1 Tax=Cyclotella cryptica TaxID=29204 RepID=A0ABD3P481_9STRA|eukprot:CCRYP_018568-RA/>CCRYP_018568-RA protein AED:0.31 eAED:0.31 QI:222/-1/1/1/-1/1/1/120/639
MELNPSGQVKSLDQIRIDRNRSGYCETCRIDPVRCFEIRKGVFGMLQQRNPLTVPGLVYNGICLRCHPHIAGEQQNIQNNEKSRRPSHQRYGEGEDLRERGASLVRQNGTRDFRASGEQQDEDDDEMVEEEIVNVLGETVIVRKLKKKKKKKKSREETRRRLGDHRVTDLDAQSDRGSQRDRSPLPTREEANRTPSSPRHAGMENTAGINTPSNDYFYNDQSLYDHRKIPDNAEEEDQMDELEKLVAQHIATTHVTPKFVPQNGAFLPNAELVLSGISDDTSVLTMPTVFAGDGSVVTRGSIITRSAQRSFRGTGELSNVDERSSSTSGNRRSVASHELHEPAVPNQSEQNYLESADELSPDIDIVRDVVKDCMQTGNDNEAIEVVRQALMESQSLDLALFCLTTLWVLVRKSDDNKQQILNGSNEKTRDDETPFCAIIEAMLKFASAEIQTRACGVLWSISMNPDYRKDVAQLGGCQAILQAMLMFTDNESLQVMALGALKVLSSDVVGKSTLRLIDASSVVADSMFKHIENPTIQSEGCAVICNLATGANNFVSPVTEREISAIVNSILSHPDSSNIQEGACFALMRLASSMANVKMIRQNPRAFEAIGLASQKHPDVVGTDIQVLLGKLREYQVKK